MEGEDLVGVVASFCDLTVYRFVLSSWWTEYAKSKWRRSPNTARNLTRTQPAVIIVPVSIPLPEKLDLSSGNQAVKWQRLSRVWSNYAQLKDPENKDRNKERRTAILLTCIGLGALDVIDAMEFDTEDQRKDPEIIRTKIENVFNRRD